VARRLYVDTSAYLCVLLGEGGSKLLAKEMAGAELLSSVLLVLEATRNLVRLSRDRLLTPTELHACLERLEQDRELFALRDLTIDLCTGTTMPVVTTPRSLDLAHLRTALWFHERAPLTRLVTLDETQAAAAREAGLPV
jgi:hypothetical protein